MALVLCFLCFQSVWIHFPLFWIHSDFFCFESSSSCWHHMFCSDSLKYKSWQQKVLSGLFECEAWFGSQFALFSLFLTDIFKIIIWPNQMMPRLVKKARVSIFKILLFESILSSSYIWLVRLLFWRSVPFVEKFACSRSRDLLVL